LGHQILLSLGGNLPSPAGEPVDTLRAAVQSLRGRGLKVDSVSAMYQTAPVPASKQPDFINCALAAKTDLSAAVLLNLFQQTEKAFGRKPADRWSARSLDIDLLAYGDKILPSNSAWEAVVSSPDPSVSLTQPTVPHPRLHLRAFVLVPLMNIAPDWLHPFYQKTIRELRADPDICGQARQVSEISAKL
jgi:2-amino-4-hydroxy-6-hydroxymethyldihydropteridine diphosphokinase